MFFVPPELVELSTSPSTPSTPVSDQLQHWGTSPPTSPSSSTKTNPSTTSVSASPPTNPSKETMYWKRGPGITPHLCPIRYPTLKFPYQAVEQATFHLDGLSYLLINKERVQDVFWNETVPKHLAGIALGADGVPGWRYVDQRRFLEKWDGVRKRCVKMRVDTGVVDRVLVGERSWRFESARDIMPFSCLFV